MSGVCHDCPGSVGCCYTEDRFEDEDDDRSWEEWFWDVGFNIVMWAVIIGIAIGIAGLCFFAGMWGFVSGFALLR